MYHLKFHNYIPPQIRDLIGIVRNIQNMDPKSLNMNEVHPQTSWISRKFILILKCLSVATMETHCSDILLQDHD